MASKFPKPWYRPARGVWYVTIDGKQYNLGPDQTAAFDEYHRLMALPHEQRLAGDSVAEILDAYLEWCKLHRRAATYEWYRGRAQEFLAALPRGLKVAHLKPFHLQRFIDSHKSWAPGNKRNACRAIQRPFAWAVQQGYIERSPLMNFEKPPAGRRNQTVTEEEYQKLLATTRDDNFKDLLRVTWETGARPQEVLRVEARHVELDNCRWVFPPEEAKGGKTHRIIYLNETAQEITKRLVAKYKKGPIFRNTRRKPWTTDAVNCRFTTLQKKLKTRYCLYVLRHTWATNALRKGVDPITVSVLMGHSDTNMLARTYAHLTHDPKYLQQAASRVTA
jgi:integrase/recombinase XerD